MCACTPPDASCWGHGTSLGRRRGAAGRSDRGAARRAALRARHRVPRRAHVLAPARARAGRVDSSGSRSSTRSRVDFEPFSRDPRRRGHDGRPRVRAGPRDHRARVRARTGASVRHAGRGRASSDWVRRRSRRSSNACSTSGLTKGDRLTDWTRRPLRAEQRVYAAADVEYLLALHDVLVARLEPMGRLDWALDECEERRLRVRTRPEPEVAWWRMKGARQLRGRSRGVAQEVGAWRERTAAAARRAAALRALRPGADRHREPPAPQPRGADRDPRRRRACAARRRDRRTARRGRTRASRSSRRRSPCPNPTTSTARSRPRSR